MKYYIINDYGEDEPTDVHTWQFFISEFGHTFFGDRGAAIRLTNRPINNHAKIYEVYNDRGILIAWKTD
jgi:hypothetical protein